MKTTHHKKQHKAAPAQKAQAAKKHHKNTKAEQKAPEQKAQAAKKHAGKHSHQQWQNLLHNPQRKFSTVMLARPLAPENYGAKRITFSTAFSGG